MIDYTVHFPLEILDGGGFESLTSDQVTEVVKYNIKSTLLTCKGERPFLPDFGFCMRSYLFEFPSENLLEVMRQRIIKQLAEYVSYIRVSFVQLGIAKNNPNMLKILIKYSISEVNIEDLFELDVELSEPK